MAASPAVVTSAVTTSRTTPSARRSVVVEDEHTRRRAAPRGRAAARPAPRPCRGTRRPGRGPTAAGRRGRRRRPPRRRSAAPPSTRENSTATQKSPGVAAGGCPGRGRGRRRTAAAREGEREHLVGRHPAAGLDAQVLAGHQGRRPQHGTAAPASGRGVRAGAASIDAAGHRSTTPVGEGHGPVELVGGEHHGGAGRHRLAEQGRRAGRDRRRRGRRGARRAATARAGGRPPRRGRCAGAGRPTGDAPVTPARRPASAEAGRWRWRSRRRRRPTVRPQKRTFSATVRSSYRPLSWPSSPTWVRTSRRPVRRSQPSTTASPADTATSPAQDPQQRGLAGAVGPADEDDLAALRRRGRRRPAPGTARGAPRRHEGGRPAP